MKSSASRLKLSGSDTYLSQNMLYSIKLVIQTPTNPYQEVARLRSSLTFQTFVEWVTYINSKTSANSVDQETLWKHWHLCFNLINQPFFQPRELTLHITFCIFFRYFISRFQLFFTKRMLLQFHCVTGLGANKIL